MPVYIEIMLDSKTKVLMQKANQPLKDSRKHINFKIYQSLTFASECGQRRYFPLLPCPPHCLSPGAYLLVCLVLAHLFLASLWCSIVSITLTSVTSFPHHVV